MATLVYSRRGDVEFVAILVDEDATEWVQDEAASGYEVSTVDIGDRFDHLLTSWPVDRPLQASS